MEACLAQALEAYDRDDTTGAAILLPAWWRRDCSSDAAYEKYRSRFEIIERFHSAGERAFLRFDGASSSDPGPLRWDVELWILTPRRDHRSGGGHLEEPEGEPTKREWARWLEDLPDRPVTLDAGWLARALRACDYENVDPELLSQLDEIVEGSGGFNMHYEGARDGADVCTGTPYRTRDEAEAIHGLLRTEFKNGWLLGPFELSGIPYKNYRVSPICVVPKKSFDGRKKWRLVHNLSAPRGGSFNDSTTIGEIVLQDVRDAVAKIDAVRRAHPEAKILLSLMDWDAAYKRVPVRGGDSTGEDRSGVDDDRAQLGLRWFRLDRPLPDYALRGEPPRTTDLVQYHCAVLTFGARSSVDWFVRIGNAVQHLFNDNRCPDVPADLPAPRGDDGHGSLYVDDTLLVAVEERAAPQRQRHGHVSHLAGLPVSLKHLEDLKFEENKEFLGVVVDAGANELRISEARLRRAEIQLEGWADRKVCRRRELESLVGTLNFLGRCIGRSSKCFLQRLWLALRGSHGKWVRLSRGARLDIAWWRKFIRSFNGVSTLAKVLLEDAIFTDASMRGWGAVFLPPDKRDAEFICGRWPDRFVGEHSVGSCDEPHIQVCEMAAVLAALEQWGHELGGRAVVFRVDNSACVGALNAGRTRDPAMGVILRRIFSKCAELDVEISARWIPTKANECADVASRDPELTPLSILSVHGKQAHQVSHVSSGLVDLVDRAQRAQQRFRARSAGARRCA
jgi:hypothetical protein